MNILQRLASNTLKGPRRSEAVEEADGGGRPLEVPDSELVEVSQKGDQRAFDELVTRHRGRVYAMIYNMVKNDADAWDLSQVVFVKAWKALPKFKAEAKFTTWIFRIAHNAVYDWMRKKKIVGAGELDDNLLSESQIDQGSVTTPHVGERPDKALQREELRGKINIAIDSLKPQHKEIVLLREVQGMDYKEIAEILDCSMGTVMSRLYYARQNLQKILKDEIDPR